MSLLPESAPAPRFGNFCITAQVDDGSTTTIDVRTNKDFVSLSLAFESVMLVSAYAVLSTPAQQGDGKAVKGHAKYIMAYHRSGGGTTATDLNKAATSAVYYCDDSSHVYTLPLPAEHNFGKELKATVLGNSNPILSVLASGFGTAADEGTVKLHFRASFHGSALG
jgi:hypothetical protein